MNSSREQYNLPGYGLITYQLYPHARCVFDLLEDYGHIERLESTDHLGALRNIYSGAHHTRYEYTIAQLSLITELCSLSGHQPSGFNLGSNTKEFGLLEKNLSTKDKGPSTGEITQILILLSNIGHLPTTFAGERAILKFLKTNSGVRRAFRQGLATDSKTIFDDVIDRFDVYRFHYLISLFLLQRYTRKRNAGEIVNLCSNVLHRYLRREGDDSTKYERAWSLFRSIRRVSYLTLDSLYTPVPFSLDLNSIFLSLEHYLQEVFSHRSNFQQALVGLETVMRDSVYMTPEALIQISATSEAFLSALERYKEKSCKESSDLHKLDTVTGIKRALGPKYKGSGVLLKYVSEELAEFKTKGDYEKTVHLTYDYASSEQLLEVLGDTVDWESRNREKVGLRSCRFGAERDPSLAFLRVAASLRSNKNDAIRKSFRIARQLTSLESAIASSIENHDSSKLENGIAILEFLLRSTFGWDHLYRLTRKPGNKDPVLITNGSSKAGNKVKKYLKELRNLNQDDLHEVEIMAQALSEVQHRGRLISFTGSTQIIKEGEKQLAEFDGVAFMLGRRPQDQKLLIIEAKNTSQGHTQAKNQLQSRLDDLNISEDHFKIKSLGTGGAYALYAPHQSMSNR